MKLLVLIHRLPCPPDGGAKLRIGAQLGYLADRHDVWCAGFVDEPRSLKDRRRVDVSLKQWRAICRGVLPVPMHSVAARARAAAGLVCGGTATEAYFASAALRRGVARWSGEIGFDAVLAFSSSMAPLALQVPARRRVLELDDFDSHKWSDSAATRGWPMSWVYRTEARRLASREREWLAAFDASAVINEREAALVTDRRLRERLHVIEAATPADLQRTCHGPSAAPAPLPAAPEIGFVGAMDYRPNVEASIWFARAIWPVIRQREPEARFWLIGRSPVKAIRRLDNGRDVHVTGTVSDVDPYLRRLRVSVAPLRVARGVQIKVLTAMAAGRPCVVTPCVAEGINARAGEEIVVADSPAAFAEAVLDLLRDDRRAEAIARAGWEFVARKRRPEEGLARLESLLVGCPGEASTGRDPVVQPHREAGSSRAAQPVGAVPMVCAG